MKILLLSRHVGAMAPFLAEATGATPSSLHIGYIDDAQVAFSGAPFVQAESESVEKLVHRVTRITTRETSPARFDRMLAEFDAVYVASGSTFALLEALQTTGNSAVLTEHVRKGLPYVGASAGSIIAGPDVTPASLMDDPADGPALTNFAGLAVIDKTIIPHADGQLPPYPLELIRRTLDTFGDRYPLISLRDDQALLVDGDTATVVHSSC